MSILKPSSIPSQTYEKGVIDWAMDCVKEGEAFLKQQKGFQKIGDVINAVMAVAPDETLRPTTISSLSINQIGKIFLDLSSALTDTKIFWSYKTRDPRYDPQSMMAQEMATDWWTNRLIDIKFGDVIKYALAGGSSYAHLTWDQDMQDQNLMAEDPRDVIPIRPADNISIQNCFGVAVRRARPVNYLRHLYPEKAAYIVADRDGSFSALGDSRAGRVMGSGFLQNLYSSLISKPAQSLHIPTCDVFTVYVKDDSINQSSEPVVIGEPDRNWSYVVAPGGRLYPRGRTIVLTSRTVLRDGPNIYWHGMFPLPKLTLDPVPWAFLGKSPLVDLLPISSEVNRVCRGISDWFEKNWRPDLIADKNAVPKAAMARIDTRRSGLKMSTNPIAGTGAQIVYPTNIAAVQEAMAWLTALIDKIKELSGTQELTSLAMLGQLPATETIEKMQEAMSPAVRVRSRVMEAFMREFAYMVLMNMFQFYDLRHRTAILGARGLTFEDMDTNPGNMIPASMNGDTDAQKALAFSKFFKYEVTPGSLLSSSDVTQKMLYIQLSRMGMIDPATVMEKLGIPNIGLPTEAGQTIFDRMKYFSSLGWGMPVGPAGASAAGRKASGQEMPRMKITES